MFILRVEKAAGSANRVKCAFEEGHTEEVFGGWQQQGGLLIDSYS